MKKRVSLTDIATRLGVSKMTVSLALRKHPRISTATQQRVESVAKQMGYKPNPEVAKYMSAIRHDVSDDKGLPLAYITTGAEKGAWRNSHTELQYWEGAQARAKEYGYYLEEYWLDEPSMSEQRMSDILWHRGIKGVVLHPLSRTLSGEGKNRSLGMSWDQFATVTLSDTLEKPVFNRVLHDHYTSMLLAMDALIELGYRRIGLCLTEHMDLTVNQRWQAGYRVYRANHPIDRIEPLIVSDLNPKLISNWANKNKLEVIISAEDRMPDFFTSIGIQIGKDIGYVELDLNPRNKKHKQISGIVQNSTMMGSAAIDLVLSGIQRNEHGVPEIPLVLQVEGNWLDQGSTPKKCLKKAR